MNKDFLFKNRQLVNHMESGIYMHDHLFQRNGLYMYDWNRNAQIEAGEKLMDFFHEDKKLWED